MGPRGDHAWKGVLGKLKNIVGAVAPTLGAVIGTANPLAGAAINAVTKALGVNTPREAVEMLENNPDALVKLRTAEMDFEAKMKELGIQEQQLYVEDVQDARTLFKTNIWPQIVLSAAFILGYFVLVYLFLTTIAVDQFDDWQKGIIGTLIGVLTAAVIKIVDFWFGSSAGSKDKTAKLG